MQFAPDQDSTSRVFFTLPAVGNVPLLSEVYIIETWPRVCTNLLSRMKLRRLNNSSMHFTNISLLQNNERFQITSENIPPLEKRLETRNLLRTSYDVAPVYV